MKSGVLLVANYSNKTGYAWNNIYRLFGEIGKALKPLGVDTYVSFANINPPVDNFDPKLGFSFYEYEPADKSLKNAIRLLKFVSKHNIKYVYFTDQGAFDMRYAILRLAKVEKIIVHCRISVSDPYPATYEGGVRGQIKSLLGKWDLICADKIYAVSDFVKNRLLLKNRLPQKRVIKILNGIDIHRFAPVLKDSTVTRPEYVRIFVGGRATRHKGIHVLIEAAATLKNDTETPFEIRYAGDGPDINYFKQLVKENNLEKEFIFLSELSSTHDEVIHADIIVVPSIWGDACPSSVSEALASGVPLITTSVGGVPEIVGQDNNAILVPPGDPDGMRQALVRLINSFELRVEIGKNGRNRAIEALDERAYHQTVIRQLLNDFGINE